MADSCAKLLRMFLRVETAQSEPGVHPTIVYSSSFNHALTLPSFPISSAKFELAGREVGGESRRIALANARRMSWV